MSFRRDEKMDSKSLEEYGFREWHSWNKLTVINIPYRPGVYVIRLRNGDSKRKVDESDILYIGESKNLVQRIFGNYLGGVGGETTQRIHILSRLDENLEKTEISWVITKNDEERKDLEDRLIGMYKREHDGKRPPWSYSRTLENEIERLKKASG